jgi:hypothetical protein
MTIYSQLGSSLMLEWAADEPTTIYEDTGGTDQAEDADLVAAWRTTTNGSLSLLSTQSTSGSRPTYRADYASSGYPAIEFDGTDDGLLIPHNAALSITSQTIFIVAKADTISNWRMLISKLSSGSWTQGLHIATYGSTLLTLGLDAAQVVSVRPGTTSRFVICARYDGSFGKLWRNDYELATGSRSGVVTGHTANGGIGNGGASGGNYPWDGAIQHILWCSGSCPRAVVDYVVNALGDRWGISIEDPPAGTSGFTGLSGLTGRLGT